MKHVRFVLNVFCLILIIGTGSAISQEVFLPSTVLNENEFGLFSHEVLKFLRFKYPDVDFTETESLSNVEGYGIAQLQTVGGPFLSLNSEGVGNIGPAFAVLAVVAELEEGSVILRPDIAVISIAGGFEVVARYTPHDMRWEHDYRSEGESRYHLSTETIADNAYAISLAQRKTTTGDIGGRTRKLQFLLAVAGDVSDPRNVLFTWNGTVYDSPRGIGIRFFSNEYQEPISFSSAGEGR